MTSPPWIRRVAAATVALAAASWGDPRAGPLLAFLREASVEGSQQDLGQVLDVLRFSDEANTRLAAIEAEITSGGVALTTQAADHAAYRATVAIASYQPNGERLGDETVDPVEFAHSVTDQAADRDTRWGNEPEDEIAEALVSRAVTALAHELVEEPATAKVLARLLDGLTGPDQGGALPWREQIAGWVQTWVDKHWPTDTPHYLITGSFVRALATDPEMQQLAVDVVLDPSRGLLLLTEGDGDSERIRQLRIVADGCLTTWISPEVSLLRIARVLAAAETLSVRNASIPPRLPATYAAVGSINKALGIASSFTRPHARSRALSHIAKALVATAFVTRERANQALNIALDLSEPIDQADALVCIAKALADTHPDDARQAVVRALEVAPTLTEPGRRADTLARIASILNATDAKEARVVAQRALGAAQTVTDPDELVFALINVAHELVGSDPEFARVVALQALEATSAVVFPDVRAHAMASIADTMSSIEPALAAQVAAEALDIADTVIDQASRAGTMAILARLITSSGDLAGQAIMVADAIDHEKTRDDTLGGLARAWATTNPQQSVEIAHRITRPEGRAVTLATIADALSTMKPALATAVADEALSLAHTIVEPRERADALTRVAMSFRTLKPEQSLAVADQALDAAQSITHPRWRSTALDSIVAALSASDEQSAVIARAALEIGRSFTQPSERSEALTRIAKALTFNNPDMAGTVIDEALDVAATITDDSHDRALASVAETLATIDPRRALRVAHDITYPYLCAATLSDIANSLTATHRTLAHEAAHQAIEVASGIDTGHQRISVLASLVTPFGDIDINESLQVAQQALEIARRIAYPDWRPDAMGTIAQALVAVSPVEALQIADEAIAGTDVMDDPDWRQRELAALATTLAKIASALSSRDPTRAREISTRALALVESVSDPEEQAEALSGVATAWAATDHQRALEIVGTMTDPSWRAEALIAIAKAVGTSDPARAREVAHQAFEAAAISSPPYRRELVLAAVRESFANTHPETALRALNLALEEHDDSLGPNPPMKVLRQLPAAEAARTLARVWLATDPWVGWNHLPRLCPDQLPRFIELATATLTPGHMAP